MTYIECTDCNLNEVPPHLRERGLLSCFPCQSDRVGLGPMLQPRSLARVPSDICVVCGARLVRGSRIFSLCANCLKCVETNTQKSSSQLEQSLHRPWLVKSVGRILGPMSIEEVERGLRAKEIGPLDEITQPFSNWKYVREEPTFQVLLEELRTNAHAREDTLSITVIENTAGGVAEIIRDVKPLTMDEEFGPIKHYEYDFGERTTKVSRTKFTLILAALLCSATFVFLVFNSGTDKYLPETDTQLETTVHEALYSKNQIERQQALGILRAAHERRPLNDQLSLNLALLNIEQRETVPAMRILETRLKSKLSVPQEIQVRNAMALALIVNGQYEKADAQLEKVLELNGENFITLYNMAAVHLLDENLVKAREFILRALDQRPFHGESVALFAEIALKAFDQNHSKSWLEVALKRAYNFLPQAIDRQQEMTILISSLLLKLGRKDEAVKAFEGLVEIDPELSQDHLHDLMIYKDHVSWEKLLLKCRELSSQLESSARFNAAFGLCHFKAEERLVGREVVEDALKRAPDDLFVQTVYGYIQNALGHKDLASAAFKRAVATGEIAVALILHSRFCLEQDDFECASQNYQKLTDKFPAFIQAKVGQAQMALAREDRAEAERLISSAEKMSANYIPLLRLKEQMSEKGVQ